MVALFVMPLAISVAFLHMLPIAILFSSEDGT
jgi:hypothetical protein